MTIHMIRSQGFTSQQIAEAANILIIRSPVSTVSYGSLVPQDLALSVLADHQPSPFQLLMLL
jgi:hypothetical protein